MNRITFHPDFHLFDGEGGAGEGASQSGSEQNAQQVVYGRASEGNGQTPGQVGTDNGGQAQDLNAEFAALVGKGGKYHDAYGQMVSNVIQDRFKNQAANMQKQMDSIAEGLSPLFMNYGLETGDFEGLNQAIAQDDAFYQANAEREGLDVNQYKQKLALQAEAERGRRIIEAQRQQQMYMNWEAQADELKTAFPNFDLGLELQTNEQFAAQLQAGVDVRQAFIASHIDEILQGANAEAHNRATQGVVSAIQQRAERPMEAGVKQQPGIQRKSDPSKLNKEDWARIDEIIAAGGSVSF